MPAEFTDVFAFEQHLAARRLNEPQDRPSCCGFTAAGFAHEPQCFTAFDRKADAVYRVQRSALCFEIFFQVFDLKNRVCHQLFSFRSMWKPGLS